MAVPMISIDQITCSPAEAQQRIAANWQGVVAEVAEAARASDRPVDAVRVVGVSKYVDTELTQWLVDAGCHDLGENRPQVLCQKAEGLVGSIRWHQIGHLQRNKVRRLMSARPMIHSIDSERLLNEVIAEATRQECTIDVLLEINVSAEEAKTGLPVEEASGVLDRFLQQVADAQTSPVRIVGLMAMAAWGKDLAVAQQQFAKVRELRDELQASSGLALPELSMGMSGDFPAAIAEGATLVRVGSKLFGGVLPPAH
ncbi:hypothetical protein SAMN06265222_10151 [Neorhodopirellula lusitana]|uniref:Pyridoxal phosphate homeostasis protein n=1 Tax=Neorhodopirellula lusitana TaxID=445327 RepID=A0ABY1PMT6_9BACT|nr:YggS family pyridoxal phosphate-dependent enzyme [Neorhodopirellula lusitana]SMP37943.1 hypothetical protein SAMN06265222_10151 [Neorhodopirellula lusitana]